MLLIILLGVIAKLALVSGQCEDGIGGVNNFNFSEFSADGIWYWREHDPQPGENKLDCVISIYGIPEGNRSLITVKAYDKSTQRHATVYGNATNWNDNGYWEERYPPEAIPSGRVYVIAVDNDSYLIMKYCQFGSNKVVVYVAYRSSQPDGEARKKVKEELRKNNIDIRTLVNWPADHCPQLESTERGSSTETPV